MLEERIRTIQPCKCQGRSQQDPGGYISAHRQSTNHCSMHYCTQCLTSTRSSLQCTQFRYTQRRVQRGQVLEGWVLEERNLSYKFQERSLGHHVGRTFALHQRVCHCSIRYHTQNWTSIQSSHQGRNYRPYSLSQA